MPMWKDCICRRISPLPANNYFVYVIELSPEALPRSLKSQREKPRCVYVGQSWHTPLCRLAQHRAKYKANSRAHKYSQALLPEFFAALNPLSSKRESIDVEKKLALELRAKGLHVYSG